MSSDNLEHRGGKPSDTLGIIYALREAAVDHGLALASLNSAQSSQARDHLLATQVTLEERTIAAIDQCAAGGDSTGVMEHPRADTLGGRPSSERSRMFRRSEAR